MTADPRPSWHETWLAMLDPIALRSKCVNSQVAAVVVSQDDRFSWFGYNGPPQGLMVSGPCSGWCPRAMGDKGASADYSTCASIHAEINALLRSDASLIRGGTMYVNRAPCINCAKVIANSGLKAVICDRTDEDDHATEVFQYLRDCGLSAGYLRARGEKSA